MSIPHAAVMLLDHALTPLAEWLSDPATEEIAINAPGTAWIRRHGRFGSQAVPALDYDTLEGIAHLAGALRRQDVGNERPLLATELPNGERLQVVLPPAVPSGSISLTFRKPGAGGAAPLAMVADRYDAEGWNRWQRRSEAHDMAPLLELYDAGDLAAFLDAAVRARLNILLTGATGSGKTSLARTLLRSVPMAERIITIEDALELDVPQPNHVRLLFAHGTAGGVAADDLLAASLRMRPDRVMLQELRTSEAAWTYAMDVMAGHPGSITTIHGGDPTQAFRRLFALAKGSVQGRGMSDATMATLLAGTVDLIIPHHNEGQTYSIREAWFAADAVRRGETALDLLNHRESP